MFRLLDLLLVFHMALLTLLRYAKLTYSFTVLELLCAIHWKKNFFCRSLVNWPSVMESVSMLTFVLVVLYCRLLVNLGTSSLFFSWRSLNDWMCHNYAIKFVGKLWTASPFCHCIFFPPIHHKLIYRHYLVLCILGCRSSIFLHFEFWNSSIKVGIWLKILIQLL